MTATPADRRSFRLIVVGLASAGAVAFAELYGVQALLPVLARDLHVDAASAALVQSAGAMGVALGVGPWAYAAHRLGRVRALRLAVALTAVLGFLVPLLPTLEALVIARFAHGVAIAGIPTLALVYLNEMLDARRALLAAGWYVAGTSIGGPLGRFVAGGAGALGGWRAGLLAVSFLSVAAAIVFFVLTWRQRPHPDATTAAALRPASRSGLRALRDARLWPLFAVGLLVMGAFVALYNYLGFRLVGPEFHLPDIVVSLVFVVYAAGTFVAPRVTRSVERWGVRPVLAITISAMLAGILLTLSASLVVALAGLTVATGAFFGAHAVAASRVAQLGVGSAVPSATYTLAYYSGAGALGWSVGLVYVAAGWPWTVATIASAVALSLLLALLLVRDRPEPRRLPV